MARNFIHDANHGTKLQHEEDLLNKKLFIQFHMFFIALIFTTLSLSIQFPVKQCNNYLKFFQFISWLLLSYTGIAELIYTRVITNIFSIKNNLIRGVFNKIFVLDEAWIWVLFIISILCQMIVRISCI